MEATKEEIIEKGYQILEDLKVEDYYTDREPKASKSRKKFTTKENSSKELDGWTFTVSAPDWQFENDQGLYIVTFYLDGTPYQIIDGTGGRGLSAFVYFDANTGKYKATLNVEDLPK